MTLKTNRRDCGCGCGGTGACKPPSMHGNKFRVHFHDGQLQYRMFDGRKHLVVPVVMARADVIMNSALTPAEELIPESWNGVPVTSGHPVNKGPSDFISANSPNTLTKWAVGRIFNARMDGVKLKAEAWIDVERARKINPKIVTRIEGGKNVDVSTGFFSKDDDVKGSLNGRQYTMITRDLKPDHLAILVDEPGACSWADGCGIRANRTKTRKGVNMATPQRKPRVNEPPPDQPREEGRWKAIGGAVAAGVVGVAAGAAAAGLLGGAGKAATKAAGVAAKATAAAKAAGGLKSPVLGTRDLGKAVQQWVRRPEFRITTSGPIASVLDKAAFEKMNSWVAQINKLATPADLTRIHTEATALLKRVMNPSKATRTAYSPGVDTALKSFLQFTSATLAKNGIKTNTEGVTMAGRRKSRGLVLNADPSDKDKDEEFVLHAEDEDMPPSDDNKMPPQEMEEDDEDDEDMPPQEMEEDDEDMPPEEEDDEMPADDDTVPPSEKLPKGNRRRRPVNNKEVSMTDIKAMVADAVKETVTVTLKELVTNGLNEMRDSLISEDQKTALKLAANQAQTYKDGLIAKIKANTSIPEAVIKTFSLEQLEATASGILPRPDYSGRMAANAASRVENDDPAILAMTANQKAVH